MRLGHLQKKRDKNRKTEKGTNGGYKTDIMVDCKQLDELECVETVVEMAPALLLCQEHRKKRKAG